MRSLIALATGLAFVALSTGAIGTGGPETARIVTIGDRTGPAFYSAIEGRYLFVDTTGPEMADLPR